MTFQDPSTRDVDVAIVGGGISGIGAAIAIREAGLGDVLVLERAGELGGTWRDNTYPGCACDIPSVIYSYPFAPNPDWTRVFAHREEIQEYVVRVAVAHGVPDCTSLNTEVLDARWADDDQRWHLDTTTGPVRARALVLAAGPLHEPVLPDVPGLYAFAGTMFHSARWRHDHDLRGARVAVIGNGASAAQFVPRIRREAEHVTVFQRTPSWVMPKMDWRIGPLQRAVLRRLPALQRLARQVVWTGLDAMILTTLHARLSGVVAPVARWNIRRAIKDPELRRAVTPDYTVGCKRVLISNDYYPALAKPDVTLVPHAVREVRERSVVDATGAEHEVDTIIFGTGFHVTDLPIAERVHGRGGRSLAQTWDGSPRAYKGTTISGFPNAFMLFGPNIGTASAFVMLDAQLKYLTDALRTMRDRGLASVDVRAEEQAADKARVDARLAGSVWNAGGCSSYYLDAKGHNASAFPGTMRRMHRLLARFDAEAYDTVAVTAPEPVATTR